MILSNKFKLIFLHNRKTGGSTVKSYINPYMGPHDIQIGAWSDAFMNGGRMNTRLVYDCIQCLALKPVRSLRLILNVLRPALSPTTYSGKRKIPKLLNRLQKTRYHYKNPGHPTATEIKKDFPEEWEHYWSFCFVRNPFKKAVSDYLWRKKLTGAEQVSFREFMERVEDPLRKDPEGIVPFPRTNWPIYTINDSVAVDFVGRHERFKKHLRYALNEIGIPFDEKKLTKSKQGKSYDYREYYDEKTFEIVQHLYANEIQHFNYAFNS